jgi:phosphoribosylaminoimidazolecarboxamide formyltransferase/IMP cyclohydrolase
MNKLALISVFDKREVINFAQNLEKLGWGIVTTGGTHKVLKSAEIKATPIEKITGNPEILAGRVKTISYQVAAGILFDRNNKRHRSQVQTSKLPQIDMVVCNLYPFEKTVSKKHKMKNALEMIDIGGVTLLRAGAKNFKDVVVVTDPKDYSKIIKRLKTNRGVGSETKAELASKAFSYITEYDKAISRYFKREFEESQLRYGENPHQEGWFLKDRTTDPLAMQNFNQLQGKRISFNNLLDISAAVDVISEVGQEKPACVIVKHSSPAGAATAEDIESAYKKAWYGGDPLAAFGGVIAVNRKVSEKLAVKMLNQGVEKKFFEILVVPTLSLEAQRIFSKRKNLIIITNKFLEKPSIREGLDYKYIRGGVLEQDFDSRQLREKDLRVATKKKPTRRQLEDLLFAWKMVKVSKSNAITIAKKQTLISSGVGQQDRKEAARIAIFKSADKARGKNKKTPVGAVAASDAFFPFSDGPEVLIKSGIKAIIQPGGSIRDQETIDLCDKYKIAMIFTGVRAFKH